MATCKIKRKQQKSLGVWIFLKVSQHSHLAPSGTLRPGLSIGEALHMGWAAAERHLLEHKLLTINDGLLNGCFLLPYAILRYFVTHPSCFCRIPINYGLFQCFQLWIKGVYSTSARFSKSLFHCQFASFCCMRQMISSHCLAACLILCFSLFLDVFL